MLPESKVDSESHLRAIRVTYVIRGLRLSPSDERAIDRERLSRKAGRDSEVIIFPPKFI